MRRDNKDFPTARENEIVIQELPDETLVYDLTTNKAVCLNPTSALIWRLCDGKNSIAEICDKLSDELRAPAEENVVYLALDQLRKEGLLANGTYVEDVFKSMSRREVIKEVGFVSAIALPFVASIVAPQPLGAQSCGDIFQACQGFPDTCCPGRDCVGYSPSSPGQCCFDDGSIPPDGPPRNPGTHCTQQIFWRGIIA